MAGTIIRRGDVVIVALQGDYGKPRPALVVQSDLFEDLQSITLCPISSKIQEQASLVRVPIEPNTANGLRQASQILIDKITTISKSKVGRVAGHVDGAVMLRVNRTLAVFMGIA